MKEPLPAGMSGLGSRATHLAFELLGLLAGLAAYPAENYLHWRSGRRYRTALSLAVGGAWILASKAYLGFYLALGGGGLEPVFSPGGAWSGVVFYWLDLVVYGAIALNAWHLLEMYRRYGEGGEEAMHTRSPGRSLPVFYWLTGDEAAIKRFLEPGFVWALSLAAGPLDPVLPGMLRLWSAALFLRGNLAYYRLLGIAWDRGDTMKELEYQVELMDARGPGRPGRGASGAAIVALAPPEVPPDTPPVEAIYDRLEGFDHLLTRPASMPASPGTPSNGCPPQIPLACPCGMRAHVPATFAGKNVTCRRCGNQFRAPDLVTP